MTKPLFELQGYINRLDDLRSQMLNLLQELPAEALNWRPLENGDDHVTNSLAVLAVHVAGAEHFWMAEVIGKRPPTRDRDAEFRVEADDAGHLCRILAQTGQETQEILNALSETDLDDVRRARDRTVPVRWAILHAIEHMTLHLGHMQLTYQLWQGGAGVQHPRWFERLRD